MDQGLSQLGTGNIVVLKEDAPIQPFCWQE